MHHVLDKSGGLLYYKQPTAEESFVIAIRPSPKGEEYLATHCNRDGKICCIHFIIHSSSSQAEACSNNHHPMLPDTEALHFGAYEPLMSIILELQVSSCLFLKITVSFCCIRQPSSWTPPS